MTNLLQIAGIKKANIDEKFAILNQGNKENTLYKELYDLIFSDYNYSEEVID